MADVGTNDKRFGLMCPKKKALSIPRASNVFGNEEESSDEDGSDWVKKALRAEGQKNLAKKQTRLNIEKALKQDPTICQYDEVFDNMKKDVEEKDRKKKTQVKKAKYIDDLLKTAERRKREQEHRIERMVQKEREAEGATFADKESFVTSAYRAKLEEFNKMEKEEEKIDRLESIGDVTKQPDMSGFYRHLYRRTMDDDESPDNTSTLEVSNSNGDRKLKLSPEPRANVKQRTRQYRQRATESPLSESEIDQTVVQTINKEISMEERITSDDTKDELGGKKIHHSTADEACSDKESNRARRNITIDERETALIDAKNSVVHTEFNENGEKVEKIGKTTKVSIWEKRTVGPIFVAALERYYARKAMQLGGS
ncbi:nuclear speckle splicing regulatory protein 1 [Venturia canescens]|uniref:nuclear speckle splicing regulatory protein 1 n=1 Tax=Venturia canescens TaxID=32260 RepID=UPI001C9C01C9|nr:nuclear speckle splicing regulatory protein 1 [Venturia canescens]